jgi:hypothetical protein
MSAEPGCITTNLMSWTSAESGTILLSLYILSLCHILPLFYILPLFSISNAFSITHELVKYINLGSLALIMSTLTFAAIEDLGHSDKDIPNPDLPEMENDALEELPLPKCMARQSKKMEHTMELGLVSFIL